MTKDFAIDGYEYFIRSTTDGRGVVIYYKDFLSIQYVNVLNNFKSDESIWIRIKLKGCDSLLVGNIYRSPSSSKENNLSLNELLITALDLKDTHTLIVGDLNYGNLNWELLQSHESLEHSSSLFMETIKDLFLYQHVVEDTRFRVGQSPSRLDLIFTNEDGMISNLDTLLPIGASDHSCLSFKFTCYTEMKPCQDPRPNFYKADYNAMRQTFRETAWDEIENDNIQEFWDNFLHMINSSIDKYVPKIKPSNKAKKKPWLNRDALQQSRKRKLLGKHIKCVNLK